MSQLENSSESALDGGDSIDILGAAFRFYRSALRRKWVMVTCVAITSSLGAVYYLTATRLYQSRAELIVLTTGGEAADQDRGQKNSITAEMPNYERILQSDDVLKEALKALPADHRTDFLSVEGDRWLEHFHSRMSVSTIRNTNIISVAYRSVNPETAYIVLNSLLDSYLKAMNDLHQDKALEQLRILSEDKIKTEGELHAKEQELLNLRQKSKIIFGSGDKPTNMLSERVISLNAAWVEAKKQTITSRALWQAIDTAVRNGEDLQEFAIRLNESLGTRLLESHLGVGSATDFATSRVQQDILEARAQLSIKLESLGENHPAIKELQEKIRVSEAYLVTRPQQLSEELARLSARELGPRLLSIALRQYQIDHNQEQDILRQYTQAQNEALEIGQQLAEMELLQNEVNTLRASYNVTLEAIKAKYLSKESGIIAKPITPASIDRRPVTPKLSVTGLVSLIGGVVLGGLTVYVLDFFDDRFHSPDDIRSTLNAPILAMIRKLPPLAAGGLESLYPFAKPNSVESEAFRTLRTALDFSSEENRRLTISSTEPSDGKTTVMASLAVAFAQAGKRTLVIDGDMRRPGITRLFDLTSRQGLSTVLRDTRPVFECAAERVIRSGQKNLDILPAGPRPVNPVELLAGDRLAELIAWAETQYDQILIDAPPSLAVADVQVIGRLVDAAILTVRPDRNRRKMVIRAAEALTTLGCRMAGIVVNSVDAKQGTDYEYGYGYGYGYGAGYGHDDADHHAEEPYRAAA